MEFSFDIPTDLVLIPAGIDYHGTTVSGTPGMEWETRYAAVGANGFGLPQIIDGVNERGLSAAAFYFANYVGYQEEPPDKSRVLAPYELVTWILTSFSSVEDVRENIGEVVVPEVVLDAFGFSPPLHYIVMDTSGDCIVLEHVDGKLEIHDDPLGIITNSPGFQWHMTNLGNFVNLSPLNHDPVELGPLEVSEMGMGSGLLGMPGDFTPPSRFIRALVFSLTALPAAGSESAVLEAFHILNQFDIPAGACRRPGLDQDGNVQYEYTLWSSVSDLSAGRYYIRTHDDSSIRMVDLNEVEDDSNGVLVFHLDQQERIDDLSRNGEPQQDQ
jgi:choloylglycine hydrolase